MIGTAALDMFDGAFQLAWVTRDLGRAVDAFAGTFPQADFSRHVIDLPCIGRAERCIARIAVAWIGALQLELIEPMAGAVELYLASLPGDGQVAAFHHVGVKIQGLESEWRARCDEMSRRGLPLTLAGGEAGRVRFAYFDMRPTVGHHVELIWLNGPYLTEPPGP